MTYNDAIQPQRSLGALRKANKHKPKSPDLTGQLRLQRHTAAMIMKQFGDPFSRSTGTVSENAAFRLVTSN
jgi:hypothetical protein